MFTSFNSYTSAPSIKGLMDALASHQGDDSLSRLVAPPQWTVIQPFLQPFALEDGQVLIEQGSLDRALYFVESGNLTVHFEDAAGRIRLAMLGAGSAVGEGSFFSHLPRSATVQAAGACKMWSLTAIRFTELTHRHPVAALALVMALGSVIAVRMQNQRQRVAVT
jgi:CRP/FNR family cyclic AMP-dependent transcriptional regulator